MSRYLHPSALDRIRSIAAKTARRPRRDTRIRAYAAVPAPPTPSLSVLGAVLDGLRRLEVRAT